MTVISATPDTTALTLTMVTDLAAPPARVWQVWADPRQLERWWGPPTWPATFEQHDVVVGGRSSYYMTGPEGEKARGWWRFLAIDEPRSLVGGVPAKIVRPLHDEDLVLVHRKTRKDIPDDLYATSAAERPR